MNNPIGYLPEPQEQHVWHHQEQAAPRVNTTLEKNTRGYSFAVTVLNAVDPDQGLDLLETTRAELALRYGDSELMEQIKRLQHDLEVARQVYHELVEEHMDMHDAVKANVLGAIEALDKYDNPAVRVALAKALTVLDGGKVDEQTPGEEPAAS